MRTVRIYLDDEDWVEIRARMSDKVLKRKTLEYLALGLDIERDLEIMLLEINIVRWNLKDGDGRTMPLTRESVRMLIPSVGIRILNEIAERNPI